MLDIVINQSVKKIDFDRSKLVLIVKNILKKVKKERYSLSINFVGERKIKKINHEYRGHNQVTDVISFALQEGETQIINYDLGDLFVCVPQIKIQAKSNNVSYKEELIRMLAHGILHLCGYDHQKLSDEKNMFKLQEKIVAEFL
ncbi:MAG: rRNA maturation RNase YbeY [Candidatus Magasanikiibacteriota bacterium]